jgi:hypothetical protein
MIPTNNMMPAFSSFKQFFADSWFENTAEEIDKLLAHKQIVMTFVYPKDPKQNEESKIYGAMEEGGRLAFARMKDPKDPNRDATDSFQAFDLLSLLKNADQPENTQAIKIFDKSDLKKIEVITSDKAAKLLSKKLGHKSITTTLSKKPSLVLKDNPDA